jgi:hypothetical protein
MAFRTLTCPSLPYQSDEIKRSCHLHHQCSDRSKCKRSLQNRNTSSELMHAAMLKFTFQSIKNLHTLDRQDLRFKIN